MRRQHPDYAPTKRREQEPSTPSIEEAFAKLKAYLRKAKAHTFDALWRAISDISRAVSSARRTIQLRGDRVWPSNRTSATPTSQGLNSKRSRECSRSAFDLYREL